MVINTDGLLKDHKKYQRQFSRDDFKKHFNHPFLVLESEQGVDESTQRAFETLNIRPDQLEDFIYQSNLRTSTSKVIKLVKKTENGFKGIVKVGRAGNCDLLIKSPAVSKLHAYFSKDTKGDTYFIRDADSKNRTYVNDVALTPNENKALVNGDTISFGRQITLVFYTPEGCYDLLKDLPG